MIHVTRKMKILNKNQQHLKNDFNSQNLTDLSRRIMFVNALKLPDYEVLYLTETWLTLDILLAVLLLNAQRIYQKTENQPTKINKTWLSISIGGKLMEPVWSYPANAEQYVKIINEVYVSREATSGVPKCLIPGHYSSLSSSITNWTLIDVNCFGFADDMKIISEKQYITEPATSILSNWYLKKLKKGLDYWRTHLLNVIGNIAASNDTHLLDEVKNQCDLRHQFSAIFSRNEMHSFRKRKTFGALFKLKRKFPQECQKKSTFNADIWLN